MDNREIAIDERVLTYRLYKRKQKHVKITIDFDGNLIVSAPSRTTLKSIDTILKQESSWIFGKLDSLNKVKRVTEFRDGGLMLFLGRDYSIRVLDTEKRSKAVLTDEEIIIHHNKNSDIREVMVKWYKKNAKEVIGSRVQEIADRTGYAPNRVVVKEQKRIWGSCSSKKNLNLNWRLIMAPIEIIDYVVCHEICHLKHMNHSKEFWNMVEMHIPECKSKRKWLKENGAALRI